MFPPPPPSTVVVVVVVEPRERLCHDVEGALMSCIAQSSTAS